MTRTEMCARLPAAELEFAAFNAARTTPVARDDAIRRGATATFDFLLDGTRPQSTYYNRAIARSVAPFGADALDELPREVAAVELRPAQLDPALSGRLLELGFKPAYQLCYLGGIPSELARASSDAGLNVERLDADHADLFFDLLQLEGVDFPVEKRAMKRAFYCNDRFRAYVARRVDGTACAWTTMFAGAESGFLGNSFTLPQFRRSGAHSALLAARFADAARLGLAVVFTDVEHGSQSHQNCERAGLRTLTINTIWSRV